MIQLRVLVNAIWSIAATLVSVISQFVLVVAVAYLGSPVEVGELIFALAVTGPIFMLTNLQLRVLLATDSRGEFRLESYRSVRLASACATFLGLCLVSLSVGGFEGTAQVISAIAFAKAIESLSDICVGQLEREERISTSSESAMCRALLGVIAFIGCFALTNNLAIASTSLAGAWLIVLLLHDLPATRQSDATREQTRWYCGFHGYGELVPLIRKSLPLGLATIVLSLQINFPRLWLGQLFGSRELGVFGVVFQVVVASQMLATAFCCPLLPRLARFGDHGLRYKAEIHTLGLLAVAGLALGGLLAITLRPLLEFAVGADYASDQQLLFVACTLVPVYFVRAALATIFRAQQRFKFTLISELIALAGLTGLSVFFDSDLGITGPAFALLLALFVSTSAYLGIFLWEVWRLPKRVSGSHETVSYSYAA